jgi:hypothetical protein
VKKRTGLLLPRRGLLGAALAAPSIIRPREAAAFFRRGGGISRPAQPPAAASVGYNSLNFWDDFTNPATVDTGFTNAFGFNFYQPVGLFTYDNGTGNAVGAPVNISISNSILTVSGTATNQVAYLTPCTFSTNARGYIGQTFENGWYIEVRMAFNPANSVNFTGTFSYPAFWSSDIQTDLNRSFLPDVELDLYEAVGDGPGTYFSNFNISEYTTGFSIPSNSISGTTSVANGDYPAFHTYGCLWVPQSKNGGTGVIRRYFDRQEIIAISPLFYSTSGGSYPGGSIAAGVFDTLDTQNMNFHIDGGYQQPTLWDYAMVWQTSPSDRTVTGP